MFESLRLKNFRSHAETFIEFCSGVNVLRGLSLSGKTNIVRSIIVVDRNRPLGGKYHSNFTTDTTTEVELKLLDGPKVLFKKVGNAASYDLDGEIFRGIGSSVPEPVKQALNLSDVNLQTQLDQSFLICSSPSDVAKSINQITKMEESDAWTSSLTTKINDATRRKRELDADISLVHTRLRNYAILDTVEALVVSAEDVEQEIEECDKKIGALALLVSEHKVVAQKIKAQQHIIRKTRLIDHALAVKRSMGELDSKINLLSDLQDVQNKLTLLKIVKKKGEKVALAQEILREHDKIRKQSEMLRLLVQGHKAARTAIAEMEATLSTTRAELSTFLATDLKGKCPLCLSEIEGEINLEMFL